MVRGKGNNNPGWLCCGFNCSSCFIINLQLAQVPVSKSVFNSYFNALCAFGHKYIYDLSAVEDMAQEVFISFWENRNDFDHINAVKAFLYTSVRNKCLNHIKHQAVMKKHEYALNYELYSEQFFTSHIIEEETINQLYIEIRNLPKAAQQIMLLALNGLKNQSI